MPWYLGLLILFAFAASVALLGQAIQNRRAPRTLAHWQGVGIHQELGPEEVAVLLGSHPGIVVAELFFRLAREGKAELISEVPLRVRWKGKGTSDPVAEAFRGALDADGRFTPEGVREVLERVHERTNEALIPYSGRITALYYRKFLKALAAETVATGVWAPESFPWLLLVPENFLWSEIPDTGDGRELKRLIRVKNRFVEKLLDRDTLITWARTAKKGFFAWPRDLPEEVEKDFVPSVFR